MGNYNLYSNRLNQVKDRIQNECRTLEIIDEEILAQHHNKKYFHLRSIIRKSLGEILIDLITWKSELDNVHLYDDDWYSAHETLKTVNALIIILSHLLNPFMSISHEEKNRSDNYD